MPTRFRTCWSTAPPASRVGMATNIPPHNLNEVVDALIALIDDPRDRHRRVMEHIRALISHRRHHQWVGGIHSPTVPPRACACGEGRHRGHDNGREAIAVTDCHTRSTRRG